MTHGNIRALIVDDEQLACRRLADLLASHSDIRIVAECANGADAIAAIARHRPDLVFLDIQMPEIGGFDVVATVGADRMPVVVFVTAYDQYAVKAFDIHAIDYLLKPYDPDRFRRALDRARAEIARRKSGSPARSLTPLITSLHSDGKLTDRIAVKSANRITFVTIADIDWVESAGNYVTLHIGSDRHLLRDTMRSTEQRLAPHGFARIHRTAIVNTARISELKPLFAGDYQVILNTGAKLTLSRRYKNNLKSLLSDI